MRWQGEKGGGMVRWERWQVPGFIQGWGTQDEFKVS